MLPGRRPAAPAGSRRWIAELVRQFPGAAGRSAARPRAPARHASRSRCWGPRSRPADLGEDFGHGLTAAEIDYLVREEWARSGDDVLWRRTKCGIGMTDKERKRVAAYMAKALAVGRCARAAVGRPRERCARCGRWRRCRTTSGARFASSSPTSTTRCRRTAGSPRDAYAAMERLRAAGRLVIPITGRPAGWCDHIARMWPVDAVVGENGALYMRYDDGATPTRPPFRRRRADAPREPRAARGDRARRSSPPCRAARWRPTSSIARPISRSISARMWLRFRARPSTASSP